jgi:hypothetical protein
MDVAASFLARLTMRPLFAGLLLLTSLQLVLGDQPPADGKRLAAEKEQLARIQQLVGNWRGVGQPQRGSTRDNWVERADWSWRFDDKQVTLVATLPSGRFFRELRLMAAERDGQFRLVATSSDDDVQTVEYTGLLDEADRLTLSAQSPPAGYPARMSFRFVAGGDRLLVLLESRSPTSDQFVRLAEVGYTRQGSGFGRGSQGRECVVTGGLGTIEVTHEGKTYYVCCTGCRDYFNDNPAEVLAEYAAREAKASK